MQHGEFGIEYAKRTEQEYADQCRKKQEKNLHRRAKDLGYELKKIEVAEPEASTEEVKSE